ncbi:hypothetical protein TVAG_283130 [Trichomonas vaginalis G3]|uniref:Exportin-T n=1 Tax=Trichomonas vaginalis (strain ATCC PRA-98 / G3) TaxID=412133 RepID=A2DEL6_TRIV3|nr:exportin-T/LOS1 family [Trichomonas vaginalis G3]EAY21143.1 hypothetical protein TVAG_283130 [Trichomonas vaginalis G3]KAI5522332.1 exportin-T/LOS1 family [Trichomonas vaginalis G3]|eukprot:XP_001582129.1 hypothetical protein [Trichomonas vaginalis G3]
MEDFYTAVDLVANFDGKSQEEINASNNFLKEFTESPDFPAFAIQNYESCGTLLRVKFMNTKMKDIIKFHGSELPIEIIVAYKDLIFNQNSNFNGTNDQSFINILSESRVATIWHLYPEQWPSFWSDFLNSFSKRDVITFFKYFGLYSETLTYENTQLFTHIKDSMRADGSDLIVTKYLIDNLEPDHLDVFEALRMLLKWVSLVFVVNNESLTAIWKGINSKITCPETLNIFKTIVKRGMPDENRIAVLEVINPLQIVANVCETEIDTKIECAVAAFLCAAGEYAIQYQMYDGYYEMSLNFLRAANDNSVVSILPFFEAYIEVDPEKIPDILTEIIQRLSIFFENVTTLDSLDEEILEVSIHAAQKCLKKDKENVLNIFIQFIDMANFDDFSTAVSVLYVISSILKNKQLKDHINYLVGKFSPIVGLEFPCEVPLQEISYCIFTTYFLAVAEIFETDVITEVFNSLVRASTSEIDNEEVHERITNALFTLVKKNGNLIQFDPSLIHQLVQYKDGNIIATSAMLIQYMSGQQADFFQQCMDELLEIFNKTPESEQPDYLILILQFVRSMTYSPNSTHIQPVTEFLMNIMPFATQSDKLLSNFIRTVYASIEHYGLEILGLLIPVDKDTESYRELCLAIKALLNSKELTDHSWAHDYIQPLIIPIISIYNSITPLDWSNVLGDDARLKVEMTARFLEMIGVAIGNPDEHLIDQDNMTTILTMVQTALQNQYDHPSVIAPLISFVRSVVPLNPHQITQDFVGPTLCFIQSSKFRPDSKEWTAVVEAIIELHYRMYVSTEGQANDLIGQHLLEYYSSSGQDDILGYLEKISQTASNEELNRHRRKFGKQFYIRLSKFIKS